MKVLIISVTLLCCAFIYAQDQNEKLPVQINVGGDIQFDLRYYQNSFTSINNQFLTRRIRLRLEGKFGNDFDFRIMPNFASSKLELQDAYITYLKYSEFTVRGGRFKTPVGLERLQSPTDNMFVELGYPTSLVPNRDMGLMFQGKINKDFLQYSVGIFNGTIDGLNNDADYNDDKDFAGRIFMHPFVNSDIASMKKLGIGFSSTYGVQRGDDKSAELPSFKTSGAITIFSYKTGVFADGNHIRFSPQMYFYSGRFGMMGEYVSSNQEINNDSIKIKTTNFAWQASVSFMITDDEPGYKKVVPKTTFDPSKGTFGALEFALRYHSLNLDDKVFPLFADPKKSVKSANAFTVGLNWYPNEYIKVMLNYEYTKFKSFEGTVNPSDEKLVLLRLQAAI